MFLQSEPSGRENVKKYWTLVLVGSFLIIALASPADTSMSQQSASAFSHDHHWANLYSLEISHGLGSYRGYMLARVRQTGDGGFAIGLTKWHASASYWVEDMGVIKLDPSGQAEWGVSPLSCNDGGECTVKSMAVLSDGRIAVTADFIDSYDSSESYFVLMMLGPDGSFQWIKTFLSTFFVVQVYDLEPTEDGGLLLAGRLPQGDWVGRLDSAGRIVWQARLDASIHSIQQTPDGGFIAAGGSGGDAWIAKFDALGNITWQRACGDPAPAKGDSFHRVLFVGDGYVAAGETDGLLASRRDVWVVKFNLLGNILWQRAYGRNGSGFWNSMTGIVSLREGGYLLCGATSPDENVYAAPYGFALKLNSLGNIVWAKKYAAILEDALQTPQGDFVLIGEQILESRGCFPVGDIHSDYIFAARVDPLGMIGLRCCLVGAADIFSRMTWVFPYNTLFSTYHSPTSVGNLSPTNPGFMPVTVYNVCRADLK